MRKIAALQHAVISHPEIQFFHSGKLALTLFVHDAWLNPHFDSDTTVPHS
jgi:hypothetical protein